MKLPKIIFKYSEIYDKDCHILFPEKVFYPTPKIIKNKIKKLKKEWNKISKIVFDSLIKLSGLQWKEKVIHCYIRSRCAPMSDPLSLSLMYAYGKRYLSNKYLILSLVHELSHQLFVDATPQIKKKILKELREKYKEKNSSILEHILILALEREVCLVLYGKKFFEARRQELLKSKSSSILRYQKAVEILEKVGSEKILEHIKRLVINNH
jgi:ERCC4-related helicase